MSSISGESDDTLVAERCSNRDRFGAFDGANPDVSVVVATYNRPALIAELLEHFATLRGQPSFEVVLVDDGSTVSTWDRITGLLPALPYPTLAIRLRVNQGRSVARNVAVAHARSVIVAITDDDCLPTHGWLSAGIAPFSDARIGVVQGVTRANPKQRPRLLSHFIEIKQFDGTFSTCNVFYRHAAIQAAGGFDRTVDYWEDVDLGWRVRRAGWGAAFAPEAVVYHQVVPLTLGKWLRWPLHFAAMPAKVARYPEYRAYLYLGLWVHWFHALFDLALIAGVLGARVHRGFFALALPYLFAFPRQHGLRGRWPILKAALHLAWDAISCVALVAGSVRHRTPVL